MSYEKLLERAEKALHRGNVELSKALSQRAFEIASKVKIQKK